MLNAYGVLHHPRKVYVIKTQHFDIIFPEEEMKMANYLAENADDLYQKAKNNFEFENEIHMPIIISPDSDRLLIEYTSYPYNRIIFYDSIPDESFEDYKEAIPDYLYKEIFCAMAKNVVSPLNKMIKKFAGEQYTPVTLYNLPFSVVEGFSYLANNRLYDKDVQIMLSQAKYEGQFPNWIQFCSVRDVYPFTKLQNATAIAFNAYLIQRYGIEKFYDFWLDCGDIHPYFAAGSIYKIYRRNIETIWSEFEETIPLPQNLEEIELLENQVEHFLEDKHGSFDQLANSAFGFVWYDNLKHEIDIWDLKNGGTVKQLFFADNISRLTVSDDGKFILISFVETNSNSSFIKNKVKIYDLEAGKYLPPELDLRDASIINLENGQRVIAGVNVTDKIAKLQFYSVKGFDSLVTKLLYEKKFNENQIPFSPVQYKNGKVLFILSDKTERFLCVSSLQNDQIEIEKTIRLFNSEEKPVEIKKLAVQNLNGEKIYTFEYQSDGEVPADRIGYFTEELESVFLQQNDVLGGIHNPVFLDGKIYFSSKRILNNEFEAVDYEKIQFEQSDKIFLENQITDYQEKYAGLSFDKKNLGQFEVTKYNPLKYMWPITVLPLFAIEDITPQGDAPLAMALGFTIKTQADPLLNNNFSLSAGWTYAQLDFDWDYNTLDKIDKKNLTSEEILDKKNKSIAVFYENTSTSADIKFASLFRCNFDGEYEFKSTLGGIWEVPIGMTFEKLNLYLNTTFVSSTDYYDINFADKFLPLKNWPSFEDAYNTVKMATGINYSNIHQYGYSKYEQFGIYLGVNLYCFWDLYQIDLLKQAEKGEDVNSLDLFAPVLHEIIDRKSLTHITQLNFGFTSSIALPKLLPFSNKNGWVYSFPTVFSLEILNNTGNALHLNIETLLLGKEIQNGISAINFYFNRFGIKFGYDLNLVYDTKVTMLADFRSIDTILGAFGESDLRHSFYAIVNLDNVFAIGRLSNTVLNSTFKVTYFTDTNGVLLSLNFKFNF